MRILFAGFKYEYGRREWGLSNVEYRNFFGTLKQMPDVEASFFAVDETMRTAGREGMNQKLITLVQAEKPDLLFTMIFRDEIKQSTIAFITQKTTTKTFNWFTDDHWRLSVFSRYWAPLFTLAGTTDSQALAKYAALGINNVVKTQWGVNHYLYEPLKFKNSDAPRYEITFVGKKYGKREKYIQILKNRGLPAEGFGQGWKNGAVESEKMLKIFSNSKINLNFTESYFSWPKQLAKLLVKKDSVGYKFSGQHFFANCQSLLGARRRQVKGRTFEVPAAGGFLLTGDADNLRDYYLDGKEIVIFKNPVELVKKCRYYLSHEDERLAIAKAGYERTIREHSYEERFKKIFTLLGFNF